MNLDELAKASCVIYVDGYRDGTGTLVTNSHILTAAHVLRRGGPVTVQFRDGLSRKAIPVERVPLCEGAADLDIAVLELGPGTDGRPPPAKLWAAKRLPRDVKAWGYPIADKPLRGVWRDSVVSGAVQDGRAQLDWDLVGTLAGHSGGPVCDKLSGLMVGVLVEGSEAGHFDRMVILAAVRTVWDGLPRPWLFAGQDARTTFAQRAAGQRSTARGGDLFKGRQEALAVVHGWLCADAGPEVPLVITGQPGAGKSAVLAHAALAIERTGHRDGVAFHARDATVGDFVDAVAAASGLDTPTSWQELVAALVAQDGHQTLAVAVDALDEAKNDEELAGLRQALRELARLDWLHVAIATRPLAARDAYTPGTHLYGLGVLHGEASENLVNLDADGYFAAGDLIAYAYTLLAQDGMKQGPPGGAWRFYQQHRDVCARLAQVVASRADRNYLVAGLSAFHLGEDDRPLDPAAPDFNVSDVPSGVGEALSRLLGRLPPERRWREDGLLTALAYGRGAGLDDQRWLAFTHALGYHEVTSRNLAELKASAVADLLLETSAGAGGLVTRLFHQALADDLLRRHGNRRSNEAQLLQLLQAEGGELGWLACSPYARSHAPGHAVEAGLLDRLIDDAGFLVAMMPAALRAALASLPPGRHDDPASVYNVALPYLGDEPGVNAAVLEFASRIQGNQALSEKLSELRVNGPYKISGRVRPFDPGRELARFGSHTKIVWGVAVLDWPGRDHPVVVTTSWDGTARVWDPRDPGRELARFDGHTEFVSGVAVLDWPGRDHPVIVTTSEDGTARVWDPRDPGRELARFDGHTESVTGVAVLDWPGLDHPVVVTTSLDGTARVWDPGDPGRELARFDGHTDAVMGVAVLAWPGLDHPVVVTASSDETARVWDPGDPGRELARFNRHADELWGVAVLDWPDLDHPVVVTTSVDGTARAWDPGDPARELALFNGHAGTVMGVAVLAWPGLDHPVVVTTSGGDGTARVWDPRDPARELARFDGHTGGVVYVAALDWPGLDHPVVVTTSVDLTARVWDPRDPGREPARVDGHTEVVWEVAALDWPALDHRAIVTTSWDGTARVWDPRDPARELARFDGHAGAVAGVAVLDWPRRKHPVVVTTSGDETARVWDPSDPGRELARFDGHTDAVVGVAVLDWPRRKHPLIVTTSDDTTARVWDPHDPRRELARFDGHTEFVSGVAVLAWPGLDHPVVVTASGDGTARVWDPRDPARELARFVGHDDHVRDVAALAWPGLNYPVVVTASDDGTARVWDPHDPGRELARFDGHTDSVEDVAVLDWPGLKHAAIITSSRDGTARVWDPLQPDRELARLPLFGQGNSAAVLDPTTLAFASSRGFLVFELGTAGFLANR